MELEKEIEEARQRDLKTLDGYLQMVKKQSENCDSHIAGTMFNIGDFIGYDRLEAEHNEILPIGTLDDYSEKFMNEARKFIKKCKCSKK